MSTEPTNAPVTEAHRELSRKLRLACDPAAEYYMCAQDAAQLLANFERDAVNEWRQACVQERKLTADLRLQLAELTFLRADRKKVIDMLNEVARECGFDSYDESIELWRSFASHLDRFKAVAEKELAALREDKARLEHIFSLYENSHSSFYRWKDRAAIDAARRDAP